MTITLWTIFEILINFYQGGLETWFIYRFLTPRSHERAKIWAVIFAVCEGCLVTAFNYFTVFEGFGSALYWASLLVFAFCFFSDNAVKKFLSISLSQVAILLITSLELNAVSSFFKISLRELVVEQSLLRFVTLIMIQISIFIVFRLILMAFKHTDDYTASDPEDEASIKIPVVNAERCIGCGACENLCPSRPFSAIYVEGHVMHRTV